MDITVRSTFLAAEFRCLAVAVGFTIGTLVYGGVRMLEDSSFIRVVLFFDAIGVLLSLFIVFRDLTALRNYRIRYGCVPALAVPRGSHLGK